MENVKELGKRAKAAATKLAVLPTVKKNEALKVIARELVTQTSMIIEANKKDVEKM